MHIATTLLIFTIAILSVGGLENGLARTPPMGWMTWQRFRCVLDCVNYPNECISEQLIIEQSTLMARKGYLAAGYEYVIVDDCWMERSRGPDGQLVPVRRRFPNGMRAVSDYVHSLKLKFGIYEAYGPTTCENFAGTPITFMPLDARTFAEWGVDYVKLDGCSADPATMDFAYPYFGAQLNSTGRPMVYSCSWPVYQTFKRIKPDFSAIVKTCNLWRVWRDVQDSWASVLDIIDFMAVNQDELAPLAGPGHWNDPDMLLIGNFGLSYDQSKSQMAIWSILAAPLIMSVDLRTIKPELEAILLNEEIIAVDQDPLGIQGRRLNITQKVKNLEIWLKPVLPAANDKLSAAVVFFNRRDDGIPRRISATLNQLGLNSPVGYQVRDLFHKTDLGLHKPEDVISFDVNPSGVVMIKLTVLQVEPVSNDLEVDVVTISE